MWYQHPLSGLVEGPASRAGSPSHELAFLQAQGALGRLWLPASSRPWWSQAHPHPSSLSGGAGSPAVPGSGAARTAGRSHRRETGGSIAAISAHKQKQQLPSSGLQSAELKFMWPQSLRGCWEGAGSPGWGHGQDVGRGPRFACMELWMRQMECKGDAGKEQSRLPCTAMGTSGKSSSAPDGGLLRGHGLSVPAGSQTIP